MAGDPLQNVIKAITTNQKLRTVQMAEAQAAEAQAMTDRIIAGIRAKVEAENADLEMKANIMGALQSGEMEARNGAEAAKNGGGPPPPILQPGGPIWERPVNQKDPMSAVSPDQFMQQLLQTGVQPGGPQPGFQGNGAGTVTDGLNIAGQNITTTEVGARLRPQEDAFGVQTLQPEIQFNQQTRPNALTAEQVAEIRQRSINADRSFDLETAKVKIEAAKAAQGFEQERKQAYAQNLKGFLNELPPEQAAALAQKLETGTPEEIAALSKTLPKTLSSKVKEAQIQAEAARADYYNAQAERQRKVAGVTARTEGEVAADRAYGRTYGNINVAGGFASAKANLGKLEAIATRLESGAPLTGGFTRQLPEAVRIAIGNLPFAQGDEDSLDAAQVVASVVQQSARQILGAQYTEKEGQRLIDRAYDVRLSPEKNAARLRTAVGQLSAQLEESQREAEYFEQNGSLKGFKRNTNPQIALPAAPPTGPLGAPNFKSMATEDLRKRAEEIMRAQGIQ